MNEPKQTPVQGLPGTPPASSREGKQGGGLHPLKTYLGDVQTAIQLQKESVAKIALAEQKRREEAERLRPPRTKIKFDKRTITVVAGATFFILAGVGIFTAIRFGVWGKTPDGSPAPVSSSRIKHPSLVAVTAERVMDATAGLSRELVRAAIDEEFASGRPPETRAHIVFTETASTGKGAPTQTIPAPRFLLALGTIPDLLGRSIDDPFTLGIIYRADGAARPFLILTTDSFESAFAGMISWEKTMPEDLAVIFQGEEGIPPWKDRVVRGSDARVLLDRARDPVLLYAFPDRRTILMAPDEETFGAVLNLIKLRGTTTQE